MMEGYTILSLLLCLSAASAASNYDVRITGEGGNVRMGRVEIYWNEQWGTVCDDGWDTKDAEVVCQQLGFTEGADSRRVAVKFGEGSGKILVAGMDCTGEEAQIKDCHVRNVGAYGCNHDQDVGVSCRGDSTLGGRREMEDLELYGEKEEEVAAEERSDDKKDADLKKKDVLQALYDLLAELEDK